MLNTIYKDVIYKNNSSPSVTTTIRFTVFLTFTTMFTVYKTFTYIIRNESKTKISYHFLTAPSYYKKTTIVQNPLFVPKITAVDVYSTEFC